MPCRLPRRPSQVAHIAREHQGSSVRVHSTSRGTLCSSIPSSRTSGKNSSIQPQHYNKPSPKETFSPGSAPFRPPFNSTSSLLSAKSSNKLQHTGLDRKDATLVIAWPQEGDIERGLKIPCKAQTCWAQVIADAEDCATFAYVTPKCLETNHVKCRGSLRAWQNASNRGGGNLCDTHRMSGSCRGSANKLGP